MSTQAALNGYTESEPFCVHLSKVNKLPYNGTTLVPQCSVIMGWRPLKCSEEVKFFLYLENNLDKKFSNVHTKLFMHFRKFLIQINL